MTRFLALMVLVTLVASASAWLPAGGRPAQFGRASQLGLVGYPPRECVGDNADAEFFQEQVCHGDQLPSWSPDGRQIAFVRCEGWHAETCAFPVLVMDADGRKVRRLPSSPSGEDGDPQRPTWSPDGTKLLARCGNPGGAAICVLDAGGDRPALPVSSPPAGDLDGSAVWSADGRKIAFIRDRPSYFGSPDAWCCQLWVANADGSEPKLIGGGPGSDEVLLSPAWSPQGQLAYIREEGNAILLSNADGSGQRMIFSPAWELQYILGWSADASKIYFQTSGSPSGTSVAWVVGADGSGASALATGSSFSLSQDGKWLAFDYLNRSRDLIGLLDLTRHTEHFVAKGASPQTLAQAFPTLSPDDTRLAFARDGDCPSLLAIYTLRLDGGRPERLTQPCRLVGTARADYPLLVKLPGLRVYGPPERPNVCPRPLALPADALLIVKRAVALAMPPLFARAHRLHGGTKIDARDPVVKVGPATRSGYAAVAGGCGVAVWRRSIVAFVRLPHVTFSASLSRRVFAVARIPQGWVLWAWIH